MTSPRKFVDLRERFGISSFLVDDLDALAPVVEELAGREGAFRLSHVDVRGPARPRRTASSRTRRDASATSIAAPGGWLPLPACWFSGWPLGVVDRCH